ncbi:MAG: insulinase family protein, partial [Lentisphaeria bacterium]|nr:insulinase family protein [Lentisphaeria bacterium]
ICALLSDNAVSLDIRAGSASLRFTLSALREKWDIAVEILRSLLQEALFDEKKLERERLSLLEEYRSNLANPEFYAFDVFCSEMAGEACSPSWKTHLKSMETLSAGELKKIFETVCLSPEKAVLGLSGALTEKEAEKTAETLLGSLKVPKHPLPDLPPVKYEKGVRCVRLELDKNQSMFLMGFPGCTASSGDRFALSILKEAAGSMSSRLFDVVRNQNGLAYYTGIKLISSPAFGQLIYYAGTEKSSLKKLEKLFEEEIRRVREKGLAPQEIQEAKKWIVFREAVRRQEPGALVHEMARNEFYGGSFREALRKVERIEALSVEEIHATVAKYLSSPTSLVLTVVPPDKEKSGRKRGTSPGK